MVSEASLTAIVTVERVGSVFSLLGSFFIIITFCLSNSFQRASNRLAFYASFGNVICNVATLMSRTYVNEPDSAGCQTQAFMIQMFMPADVLWSLAMAVNVYLVFYRQYDISSLRRVEPLYFFFCYGIPFVPAIVYIFVKDGEGHRVYGNASLWCWISKEWTMWRIFTFYLPVWIAILFNFVIYVRAGRTIWQLKSRISDLNPRSHDGVRRTTTTIVEENTKVTEFVISRTETSQGSDIPRRHGAVSPTATNIVEISAEPRRPASTRHGSSSYTDDRGIMDLSQRSRQAVLSYAKCSMLFFTAMVITWLPSSANRVHNVLYERVSEPLEIMSAFVLPLQGFWNAVIYVVTSWTACKAIVNDVTSWSWGARTRSVHNELSTLESSQHPRAGHAARRSRRGLGRQPDSDSTVTLAATRDSSLNGTS